MARRRSMIEEGLLLRIEVFRLLAAMADALRLHVPAARARRQAVSAERELLQIETELGR